MKLLDGKTLSTEIREDLARQVAQRASDGKSIPCLATILVGQDPASETYVRMKVKACEQAGIRSIKRELPETTTTAELLDEIQRLNANPDVHGILLQHPVPSQIDERACFDAIAIDKDVDGVTTQGYGLMSFGLPAYPSCTPAGIMRLMAHYGIDTKGKNAVVVGRSAILGRPLAALLIQADATVTVCHSRTTDLERHLAQADLVFAACGKPAFVRGEWLKDGCVVIDAGYNKGNVGDAHFESCAAKASAITPVPGGVGPMTIAMLLAHTVQSAQSRDG
ncbi:MAG: bifunctional methylenetetrahydrofolate dehydrogenase/methenyltetrahydrofolate cyclohydrolase [Leptospiraceae bacterium]|nr:bifunctional methylenetetrahydrofolate dehydrogenase/methenyltetrahydrofolate cyclohydrolase [Leptospiraceae bacterium]